MQWLLYTTLLVGAKAVESLEFLCDYNFTFDRIFVTMPPKSHGYANTRDVSARRVLRAGDDASRADGRSAEIDCPPRPPEDARLQWDREASLPFGGFQLEDLLVSRRAFSLLLLFVPAALAGACGGGPPAEDKRPEITLERIREDLNGERVSVPAEDGTSAPSSWRFFPNEPKEIEIVENQQAGDQATIVINLRTRTSPRAEQQGITKTLAGQLRLHYELHSYVAVRKWEIVRIENLTFAYQKQ